MLSRPGHNWLIILALIAAAFLSSFFVLNVIEADPPPIEFVPGSGLPDGTPIRVHVTGAVTRPGVYELREGDRVIEAVAVAGGASADADIDALNLARRVRDEEQLVVPERRSASPAPVAPLPPGTLIDINVATAAQLDQLPGIGEAYSRRIIDSRIVDGPFKSTDELVQRRVLPQATYDRVKDLISAGP
jgi:competence protein ComEA